MRRSRPFNQLVDDFQARSADDLAAEILWLTRTIPTLQRQLAAARQAKRRQRREAAR